MSASKRAILFCATGIDGLLLFGLARTYNRRLKGFQRDPNIDHWRQDQQQEWDRLSQSLALLGTMHAAILAISPHAPPLAFAVWLGGGALAVCGLFIVQYFSVNAFGITDEDMNAIINSTQPYIDGPLLAIAMITPTVALSWSGVLFIIGIFDYIVESDMGGGRYRVVAFIPVVGGLIALLFTVFLGERLMSRVDPKLDVINTIPENSKKN